MAARQSNYSTFLLLKSSFYIFFNSSFPGRRRPAPFCFRPHPPLPKASCGRDLRAAFKCTWSADMSPSCHCYCDAKLFIELQYGLNAAWWSGICVSNPTHICLRAFSVRIVGENFYNFIWFQWCSHSLRTTYQVLLSM